MPRRCGFRPLERRHVLGRILAVVETVQSTASRNTTAPIWNEYFTVSGMPLARRCRRRPSVRSSSGSASRGVAPRPMKKHCITKPGVRCSSFELVGDERAERLHADVDRGVEDPEQARRHPER